MVGFRIPTVLKIWDSVFFSLCLSPLVRRLETVQLTAGQAVPGTQSGPQPGERNGGGSGVDDSMTVQEEGDVWFSRRKILG